MADSPIARILNWLKAGYPDGIPPRDYPPVLGVLRRQLSDEEIVAIADELAYQSVSRGGDAVSADDVRAMVRDHVFQAASEEDLKRVSGVLAVGGWPLASDLA